MSRRLDDWLSGYMEYTENTEPPLSYHTWAGVSIIASTLQRRCFIQWGHNPIYPNVYVALIGPSGHTRKGEALSLAKPFMEHVGLTMVANKITNEQLYRHISDCCSTFRGADGTTVLQSAATIFSTEMHVFIGQANVDLLAALTDWYDCLPTWEYSTKHQGKDEISGLCINMLAATAPDWLSSMFPQEAVGGGFTSRMILVHEDRKEKIVADPTEVGVNLSLRADLNYDLEQIKLMTGEFRFSPDALETYKEWYINQEKRIKKGKFPIPDPKFAGYCARRATHIKKLAMILSASRDNELTIELDDFERAKKLLVQTEKRMPRAFRGLGRARFSDLTDAVLNFIMNRGSCLRSEILQKFYRDVDAWSLEQIERVLERMKVIRVTHLVNEEDARYTYTGVPEDE